MAHRPRRLPPTPGRAGRPGRGPPQRPATGRQNSRPGRPRQGSTDPGPTPGNPNLPPIHLRPRRERIIDGQGQQFLFEIDTSEPEPEVEVEPKPEAPARPRPKRVSRQLELDKLPRFASSTTSPRPRKPAIVAASPRPKSARTNRESSNSSPPGSNFKSMSCPSTPARGAKLASPRRNRQPGRSPRPWPAPACSPS